MLQITGDYKNAKRLLNSLIQKRSWITEQLIKVYSHLGERQREFMSYLSPGKLNRCSYEDLASALGFKDPTGIYRMVRNKFIAIRDQDKSNIFPTRLLTVSSKDFRFYQAAEKINDILDNEFEERSALSDRQISNKIEERYKVDILRRSIAGYRERAEIPGINERQKMYDSGVQVAFKIETDIEKWMVYNDMNRVHNKF